VSFSSKTKQKKKLICEAERGAQSGEMFSCCLHEQAMLKCGGENAQDLPIPVRTNDKIK